MRLSSSTADRPRRHHPGSRAATAAAVTSAGRLLRWQHGLRRLPPSPPDEQRTTVRRALNQRDLRTSSLDAATRDLVFLCQFDPSATVSQVLDCEGVPEESFVFRGLSLAVIGLLVAAAGAVAAKMRDSQRAETAGSGATSSPSVAAPSADPPSPTRIESERNPRLAQALEYGQVHYRVMWLVTRRPQLMRAAPIAASRDDGYRGQTGPRGPCDPRSCSAVARRHAAGSPEAIQAVTGADGSASGRVGRRASTSTERFRAKRNGNLEVSRGDTRRC